MSGTLDVRGYHTVDLDVPVTLAPGNDFYLYLSLSDGGHPFDRTSEVPVLLGAESRVWVPSAAAPGQSFYREGSVWQDSVERQRHRQLLHQGADRRRRPGLRGRF